MKEAINMPGLYYQLRPFVGLALIALTIFTLGMVCGCADDSARDVAMTLDQGSIDSDFNQACLAGAEKARTQLEIRFDYNTGSTAAEWEGLQRDYAESREYVLIVGIGSPQIDAMINTAADFPDQKFALIDGTIAGIPNIASFTFRDDESSFLAGALAAMVTTTDKIGFVGGMDIPVIHRFLAGYEAGAKYIDPGCQLVVSYVGSWSDQQTAEQLALAQYDQGADIVYGVAGLSGLGVIEAAKERDLYAIGVDTDQRPIAPNNVLVSVLKHVDVATFSIIEETVEGKFSAGVYSLGLEEGVVGISLDNALPVVTEQMKTTIEEIRTKIVSGEIHIP